MNFQLKAITAAVLAAGTSAAFALPQSTATTFTVDFSGATAQENGIVLAAVDLCQAGTTDIYTRTNQRVLTCTLKTAIIPGNVSMTLRKSGVGGSGNGVVPVETAGISVEFMKLTGTGSAVCGIASTVTTGFGNYVSQTCTGGADFVAPDAGFSDVEPTLLGGSGSGLGTGLLSFGIVATQGLYEALQASQGLSVGSLTEANIPSLSVEEVASIFAGNLLSLGALQGQPTSTTYSDNDTIHICRRVSTSGSQATTEVVFLNQRCNANVAGAAGATLDTNGSTSVLGDLVFEGSGSGNVVSCMNFWETDGADSDTLEDGHAIGLLSTETRITGTNEFRYIKLDGFSPSIENVINGDYPFFAEASAQPTTDGRLSANGAIVFNAIVARLTSPALIAVLNDTWDDLHNINAAASGADTIDGGYIGTSVSVAAGLGTPDARPVTKAQSSTNPVVNAGKQFTGSLQNCGALIYAP